MVDTFHVIKEAAQFAQSKLAIKDESFVKDFSIAKALDQVRRLQSSLFA